MVGRCLLPVACKCSLCVACWWFRCCLLDSCCSLSVVPDCGLLFVDCCLLRVVSGFVVWCAWCMLVVYFFVWQSVIVVWCSLLYVCVACCCLVIGVCCLSIVL